VQASVHNPVEKLEPRHALLRGLFLPCILFVAPVADELTRQYAGIGLYNDPFRVAGLKLRNCYV
jgi:hypothetical protein